jgi:N-acetylneuraminic acid mutarotase
MGRPSTKPKDLRDGYYIEVRNKNQKSGIKIRRDTRSQLQMAIDEYKENKEVIILGKQENGKMKELPELSVEQ